ncbi:uncharacterized protein LOC134191375 [Corticium candelabrum]|uniref:uncharacterized protein LOC134191375 n=1 Tax=Corticium candelabrum TaxID=121492 RepID=UPI002E256991|nr:uncharacterized protein LOC134191375 [Corticium candelabrum]
MESTIDSPGHSGRYEERDSEGFRYSRKRRRLLKELSPDSKRRKSGEFFVRQSTEAPALACTPSAGGDELVVTKKSAPVSTLPIDQHQESSKTSKEADDNLDEAKDSKMRAMLSELDECGLVLDNETAKLVEEKQKWDELVDIFTDRANKACKDTDEEQDIKVGPDGLPIALTDEEREFLLGQPNVQEIINKIDSSFQEMELTMSQWLHFVAVIEQYQRCIEERLNQKKQAIGEITNTQIPFTPRTAIKGIMKSKFVSVTDCMHMK